jgi:hypothetical protein
MILRFMTWSEDDSNEKINSADVVDETETHKIGNTIMQFFGVFSPHPLTLINI